MPYFGVTKKKETELVARMAQCGLHEGDIAESFVRGSGPGGQKINKSAICVLLKHGPTGLTVKAQEARSQALNRFYARRRLCEMLEEQVLGRESPAALRRGKIKKQKSRRKRRSSSSIDPRETE